MYHINRKVSKVDTFFFDFIDFLIAGIIIVLTLVFILYPILSVVHASFFIKGNFTLELYKNLFQDNKELLYNSIYVSFLTAAVSTILAVIIAITICFINKKQKSFLMTILMMTMISPPFVSSIAYIQLFGKRGFITHQLLGLTVSPYGWHGIVSMQSLGFTPLCALLMIGIIWKMDKSLIQASLDLGGNASYTINKVIIPLMKPVIIVCFLLSFVRALSDFGTPITIGGSFNVLATEIYMRIIAYGELEIAAAMNVIILIPALILFVIYRILMKKYNIFSKGNSNKTTGIEFDLNIKGVLKWVLIVVTAVFFCVMALQYFTIFVSGITKVTHGKIKFTLEHFDYLKLYSSSTFMRSIIYGIIVGIVGTIIGILLAYYTERRNLIGMKALDFVATLPYIIPGTCFGIGYILAFNKAPLELTGTSAIVVLNCVFKQLPITTKAGSAALSQINTNIEEAARDLGAKKIHVIKDIIFPNIKSAFLVGFINNFTTTMTTIGAIIFLIYPGQKVATLALFDAISSGEYGVGALIATILIIITMIVNISFSKLILGVRGEKNVL